MCVCWDLSLEVVPVMLTNAYVVMLRRDRMHVHCAFYGGFVVCDMMCISKECSVEGMFSQQDAHDSMLQPGRLC